HIPLDKTLRFAQHGPPLSVLILCRLSITAVYHTVFARIAAVALPGRRVIIIADRLHPPNTQF
ncbi:hypothetical protein, partial [Atlantibacter hermannii]|uniref:hypothetical protein n=1 Tax=Atlantibacter hermannii TaxID=565 RepID=UPI0028A5BC5C